MDFPAHALLYNNMNFLEQNIVIGLKIKIHIIVSKVVRRFSLGYIA